jgi:hypothetical protein
MNALGKIVSGARGAVSAAGDVARHLAWLVRHHTGGSG